MAQSSRYGFSFTKLIVADVDRVFTFYNQVFGLIEAARVRQGEGEHELDEIIMTALEGGYSVPSLVVQRFPNRPIPTPGEATLGFIVEDVDATVQRALACGGSIYREAAAQPQHGVKVAFVRDNEGHMIELVEML